MRHWTAPTLRAHPGGTPACHTWQLDLAGEFGEGTSLGTGTALPQSAVAAGARNVGDFPQQCGRTGPEQDPSCD